MKVLWLVVLIAAAGTGKASEQTDRNVWIAQQVIEEVLGRGQFQRVPDLYSPSFVNHGRTRDVDLSVDQAAARGWREAFPDLTMKAELLVAEEDLVAVLWRAAGTNSGAGNGLPATGKSGEGRGITIWRIEEGKIVEEWSEFGMLDILRQLGLVPGGNPVEPDTRPRVVIPPQKNISAEEQEQNRKIASMVFERIVGEGKLELFDSIYAKDFVNHGTHRDGTVQSEVEGTRGFRELAPDLKVKILKTIAQGDLVTVMYTAEGTNTGSAFGLPATGKPFLLRGISILRVQNGKITDEWSMLDQYAALEQLGLLK